MWLSNIFKDADRLGYTHHFATFNDRHIENLDVPNKTQNANSDNASQPLRSETNRTSSTIGSRR